LSPGAGVRGAPLSGLCGADAHKIKPRRPNLRWAASFL
jgi:hypothetical protein